MSMDLSIVLGVLAAAVVLFASGRVRLDVVALLVMLTLVVSGILTVPEALAGFSDPVVLMIAALFVVGEALVTTGIAFAIGEWLMRVGGRSENRLMTYLMATVGGIGAFMSSTGIVAIFIPIVLSLCEKAKLAPARMMMPLAFASLISGMMTLIATPPNLVVNAELQIQGLEPFGFFDFTPIGVAVLVVGLGYMALIGRRLLPGEEGGLAGGKAAGRTIAELAETYKLREVALRLRVPVDSPLVGQSLAKAKIRTRFGVAAVGVERTIGWQTELMPALAHTEIQAWDVLYAVALAAPAEHFIDSQRLQRLSIDDVTRRDVVKSLGMAEVMLTPESTMIGRTLADAAFRSRFRVAVLAIRRDGERVEGSLVGERLRFGDTLLVSGSWKDIRRLQATRDDFIVLNVPIEMRDAAAARRRAPWALGLLAAMIAAMTFNLLPNVIAVMAAALAMIAAGCLSMERGYKTINWPSLVLIAGMLPLATAMQKTGGTDLIVGGLVAAIGDLGPMAMMAGLFIVTAVLGSFMSNTATAVLLAPIAIGAAADMGVRPYPFVMTVAIAASAAFMTPVSSPVNTLVMVPGGYTFMDFFKVGVPLTVLVLALTLILVPVLFPL